ncbi:MAG: hypothetical protein KC609_23705 [Myxococcales bacterium]|nr:hypothetical protein [Myxococcales bacterium]
MRAIRLFVLGLGLSAMALAGCTIGGPGRLSFNPPVRPLKKGQSELGVSGGAALPSGWAVANLWFRYGLIDRLALDISAFYMTFAVAGGNLALRVTPYRGRIFSLEIVPGVGLGAQTHSSAGAFHISPNLALVGSFAVGSHSIYLGLRSSWSLSPEGRFLNAAYHSAALGAVFTIARRYHIHLELLGSLLTELFSGVSIFFAAPTVGFSVDFP